MATFTDNQNREWHIRLTVGNLIEVRDQAGYDLLDKLGDELSSLQVAEVIWPLVAKQAQPSTSREAFFDRFDMKTLTEARRALLEACADFFRPWSGPMADRIAKVAEQVSGAPVWPPADEPASNPSAAPSASES